MIRINPHTVELLSNWVLLSFDLDEFVSQTAELRNGLLVDKRFERYEYAVVSGEVVGVCDTLYYLREKGDWHEAPLEYQTQIEVAVGDKVFYNYLSAEKAMKSGRVIEWNGEYYVFIRYDRLYAAISSERWVGINGWKIIKPRASEVAKTGFVVHRENKKAVVLGVGAPAEDYWDRYYPETGWLREGDEIEYITAIPLENRNVSKYGDIRRVREKDVLCSADRLNPTVIKLRKTENKMSGLLDITNTSLERGVCEEGEYVYLREYEYISPQGDVYVRRVGEVVDFNNEKLLLPL